MSRDVKELCGVEKPAVAMAHLPRLPGTPLYDEVGGPGAIVDSVARDVEILTGSGFDAILFCNEGDRPYQLKATMEGVAMMARVVSEVAPRDRRSVLTTSGMRRQPWPSALSRAPRSF